MRRNTVIFCCFSVSLWASAQANALNETGFDIMINKQTGNCIACHDLPGLTGVSSNFGPSLRGIGARKTPEELLQWVVDARRIKPDTLMPPFDNSEGLHKVSKTSNLLSSTQIEKVVSTLQSWR